MYVWIETDMQCRSSLVVSARDCGVRLSEDQGSNHAADGCVYRECHCDMQPWAPSALLYCSA